MESPSGSFRVIAPKSRQTRWSQGLREFRRIIWERITVGAKRVLESTVNDLKAMYHAAFEDRRAITAGR